MKLGEQVRAWTVRERITQYDVHSFLTVLVANAAKRWARSMCGLQGFGNYKIQILLTECFIFWLGQLLIAAVLCIMTWCQKQWDTSWRTVRNRLVCQGVFWSVTTCFISISADTVFRQAKPQHIISALLRDRSDKVFNCDSLEFWLLISDSAKFFGIQTSKILWNSVDTQWISNRIPF